MAFILSEVRLDDHTSSFHSSDLWIYHTILENPDLAAVNYIWYE